MKHDERLQVLADLDLPEATPDTDPRWLQFLAWCDDKGVDPAQSLTVAQVVDATGIKERTLRRHIANGELRTNVVKGAKVKEHRIPTGRAYALWNAKQGHSRATTDPMAELSKQLDAMRTAAESERIQYRELVEQQTRVINELKAEVRDTRAQLGQLHEQLIKALPEPKKRVWWRFWAKDG